MKNEIIYLLISILILSNQSNAQNLNLDSISFTGKYQLLEKVNCEKLPITIDKKNLTPPKKDFFKEVNSTLINKLRNQKITIINENHRFPQNRVFAHYVLENLLKTSSHYYVFFRGFKSRQFNYWTRSCQ